MFTYFSISLQIRNLKVLGKGKKNSDAGEENGNKVDGNEMADGIAVTKDTDDDLDRIERCVTPSASPSRSHLKLQLLKEYDNLSRSSSGSSFPRPSNFHSKVRMILLILQLFTELFRQFQVILANF